MELDDMRDRVQRFMRIHLQDEAAMVTSIEAGPGHAGFSYLFDVKTEGETLQYFMRLPPPNVKWEGTADVLRQVTSIRAMADTDIPHAPILWSGDNLDWFGCPYFIQPRIEGDTLHGNGLPAFSPEQHRDMGRQAMSALAAIHQLEWQPCAEYLGAFPGYEWDVTRWDRFAERAADPHYLALQPRVREQLLAKMPTDAALGICHGDFQWSNLLYSEDGRLRAVIDWELTGIGPILNDVGWICVFSDPAAWPATLDWPIGDVPEAGELETMYREAGGANTNEINWFKALAAYKFGIITGLNLSLHRRGKRHDPHWEELAPGMETNMNYALSLLSD